MTARDPEADDRWLDQCLHEELGGARPPDFSARFVQVDLVAAATAAALVDAACHEVAPQRGVARWLLLAAAMLITGLGGYWLGGTWLAANDTSAEPHPVQTARALLDEFHRCMPTRPERLRQVEVRQRCAPEALPVIRRILDYDRDHPDEVAFGARAVEFVVYALALGDPTLLADYRRRAGDVDADAALLVARAITAADAHQREAALTAFAALLAKGFPTATGLVQGLAIAGDLSADEARSLAAAALDPAQARRLQLVAELAESSPRRLLGQSLDLDGRRLDGEEFSIRALRGKVVLVCFWATWCQPSLRALPKITAVAERHRDALATVGVSCDHSRAALTKFLLDHPAIDWPQLFDERRSGWHELAFVNGVRTIPSVFLIDRDGRVRDVDALDDLDAAVQRLIDE